MMVITRMRRMRWRRRMMRRSENHGPLPTRRCAPGCCVGCVECTVSAAAAALPPRREATAARVRPPSRVHASPTSSSPLLPAIPQLRCIADALSMHHRRAADARMPSTPPPPPPATPALHILLPRPATRTFVPPIPILPPPYDTFPRPSDRGVSSATACPTPPGAHLSPTRRHQR